MFKVTLKRSFIGCNKKHKKILKALGFRTLNQNVMHDESPPIIGMIEKVRHMVEVTKIDGLRTKKSEAKRAEKQ